MEKERLDLWGQPIAIQTTHDSNRINDGLSFDEYYTDELRKQWSENIKNVQMVAEWILKRVNVCKKDQKDLLTKIDNKIKELEGVVDIRRTGLLERIVSDKLNASYFAKLPTRQNISETAQLDYLRIQGKNVNQLPQSGTQSRRLSEGKIIYGDNDKNGATKALDYSYKDSLIFAKVTHGSGGHQDNVVIEVEYFLRQANLYNHKNDTPLKFVALLDGSTFSPKVLQRLSKYENEYVRVTNCSEFKV